MGDFELDNHDIAFLLEEIIVITVCFQMEALKFRCVH